MKIGNIKIKNLPHPKTGNVILNKIIEFIILPIFLIILIFIVFPILLIFGLIKSIFQKNKIHPENRNDHILLENEKFKITSKFVYLDGDNEIEKVANEFMEKVSDCGDEFGIIQFISEKGETMLDYYPYTLFRIELKNQILLQRIKSENEILTSELISFSKETGKIEILKEIGLFDLEKYDKIEQKIIGKNYNQNSELTLDFVIDG